MTYSQLAQRALAMACFVAPSLFVAGEATLALRLAPTYVLAPSTLFNLSVNKMQSAFLEYFAFLIMIPAFFALTSIIGQRAPRLAMTCAVMGLFGLGPLICGSYLNVNLAIASQAGTPMDWDFFQQNGPRPEQLIMGLPIVLYFLANVLLGGVVWRTGVLPRWAGALLIAAGFLMFDWTGPQLSGRPLLTGLLAAVSLLLVYTLVGAQLWREADETRVAGAREVMVS